MADDDENVQKSPARRKRPSPVSIPRAFTSPLARKTYVVIGTLGLTALAVAVIGPKRVRREVLEPIQDAIEPHAQKAWAEALPLRAQIAELLEKTSPAGRKKLARDFQSWIGHFRAD